MDRNKLPSEKTVERLRERYPEGTRIKLVSMDDPHGSLRPGDKGSVEFVDDLGTIFCKWDNGSGLGLAYGADKYRKLEPEISLVPGAPDESPGTAQTYTLGEPAEKMEPCYNASESVIYDCVEGLGVYGALLAQESRSSDTPQIAEIRGMIENLVPYWGLNDGKGVKSLGDFLQAFDDKVDAAVYSGGIDADAQDTCANILTGLVMYGKELAVAQGSDAMGEIMRTDGMLNEVALYFGFPGEVAYAEDASRHITNTIRGMLKEYELPGQSIEGDNVHNYVVKQAVLFDNDQGFAFAHNPDAVSPYVTWRMINDGGKLSYEWGNYFGSEEKALVDFIERAGTYQRARGLKEKSLPKPPAQEVKQLIKFIDSDYRELFKIPDGESIRITYPPSDGREPVERSCKFLDEYHLSIERNGTFHICEFAEAMERLGARYEPVNQLQNIEIVPVAEGEDKFCAYNREEGNTCAGSVHGDFGNSGDRFHSHWRDHDNGLYNSEIQSELQSVIYTLRQDLLKDRDSMTAYCQSHPDAKRSEGRSTDGEGYAFYGFKLETDSRQYFVNCFVTEHGRDNRFAVFAYADKPAPVIRREYEVPEQGPQSTVSEVRGETQEAEKPAATEKSGCTSVRKALDEGRKAPKPPRKEKEPGKGKKTIDER